jgi:hypothetical protein
MVNRFSESSQRLEASLRILDMFPGPALWPAKAESEKIFLLQITQ